jgi:hypothetical protein
MMQIPRQVAISPGPAPQSAEDVQTLSMLVNVKTVPITANSSRILVVMIQAPQTPQFVFVPQQMHASSEKRESRLLCSLLIEKHARPFIQNKKKIV